MVFDLTGPQKQTRTAPREFAMGEFSGVVRDLDRIEEFPKEL